MSSHYVDRLPKKKSSKVSVQCIWKFIEVSATVSTASISVFIINGHRLTYGEALYGVHGHREASWVQFCFGVPPILHI